MQNAFLIMYERHKAHYTNATSAKRMLVCVVTLYGDNKTRVSKTESERKRKKTHRTVKGEK